MPLQTDSYAEQALYILVKVPDDYLPKAEYALYVLSLIWGIPIQVVYQPSERPIDVVYGPGNEPTEADGPLHIPFDPDCYDPLVPFRALEAGGFELWAKAGDSSPPDLVGGSYRLLLLLDEQQVAEEARDRRGIFLNAALPEERRKAAGVPFVEQHAESLFSELAARKPGLKHARLPRWPNGKKYAVVLTHDTDAVHVGAPKELLYNLGKFVIRRDATHFQMLREGLRFWGRPSENPFFAFPQWREFEEEKDIRSCFFLFTQPKGAGIDLNDCRSTVTNQKIDWNLIRELHDDGWEIGLHASINAKSNLDHFIKSKDDVEQLLQRPIRGLRHHYWALDWRRPHRTFRMHINAGFRYDTSISSRDAPGLRSGTSLPYAPYDPEREKPLDIYELPTAIMDGHVILDRNQVPPAVEAGRRVMDTIKHVGGMAVLDWHTETGCDRLNYTNFFSILKSIVAPYLGDSDAWIATPWEITSHWHQRSLKLQGMSGSKR